MRLRSNFRFIVALIVLQLNSSYLMGQRFNPESIYLKKINQAEQIQIFKEIKNHDLIILFQPDCPSCKTQIQNQLDCIKNTIKLIGTNGSEERLTQEYQKFKTKKPGFSMALNDLKKINPSLNLVTPQFFISLKDGNANIRLKNLGYGYTECHKLLKKIDLATKNVT